MSTPIKDPQDLGWVEPGMSELDRDRVVSQILEMRSLIEHLKGDWLNNYQPNDTQWEAINSYARYLYLSGGNQIGKSWMYRFFFGWTLSQYPPEWRGPKKMGDIDVCLGSLDNGRLYSNVSKWLFGPSREELGQGFIPASSIDPEYIRWDKRNPDMVRSARLRRLDENGHWMGYARVNLWAYTEQFPHGDSYDFFGLDEEFSNQKGYYPSIIARLAARKGRLIVAATPEFGITEMYRDIKDKMRSGNPNYKLMYYSVYDADHLTDEQKDQYVEDYRGTSEFQLRVFGKPIAGVGAAFDLDFTQLMVPASTKLGDHFKEIVGIDIPHVPQGVFAAVKIAYSELTDEVVVLDSMEIKDRDYSHHIARLRDWGCDIIPIAWPADSDNRVVQGESFREYMSRHGLNILDQSAHELVYSADSQKLHQVRDVWSVCQTLQRMMIAGSLKIKDTVANGELVEQLSTFEFDENRKAKKSQIDDVADAFFKSFMMRRFAAEIQTVSIGGQDLIVDDGDWDVFS